METTYKELTNFLVELGIEQIGHTTKTYMGHLIAVYRLLKAEGCTEDVCRAGMFHSIYGTQQFQGFTLPLERRADVRRLIGERAERLAYLNCALDRSFFDRVLTEETEPNRVRDRITGEEGRLERADFDDLCWVHLYDWFEQVPRSRFGWDYRRAAYRRMAERLGSTTLAAYERVFAQEKNPEEQSLPSAERLPKQS